MRALFTVVTPRQKRLSVYFEAPEVIAGDFVPGSLFVIDEDSESALCGTLRLKQTTGGLTTYMDWTCEGYPAPAPEWAREGEELLMCHATGNLPKFAYDWTLEEKP